MGKGIFFAGRSILKPGVYAQTDVEALVPRRLGGANTIGVIGVAQGSEPRKVATINTPQEAKVRLRDGVLREVIELMYDPSPTVQGAGEIKYYRLNNAMASALILKDFQATNIITVTSLDWGVWTNQIRVKVEAGSIDGAKISINDVLDPLTVEVGDNLGAGILIQYVGAEATAQLTVIKTGDAATSLVLEAPNGTNITTVDLTNPNLSTVGALVDFLDNLADWDVSIQADQNLPVSELDAVVDQDVKTTAYKETASLGAVVFWINTHSVLVKAVRVSSAVNGPVSLPYTFLSGGSEGIAIVNSDWSDALDAFLTEDVQFIFVASEDAAVHAMALAHCNQASGVTERRERLTILGGAANESVEQAVLRAQVLADKRATLCYPGIKRLNLTTGLVDDLSPMFFSAIVSGMTTGVTVPTPLTFKQIRVSGLEKDLTQTEITRLLDRGVLHSEFVAGDGIFRIVHGITTYLRDANVIFRKLAGMRIHDFLQTQVRDSVKAFIGTVADKRGIQMMLNAVVNRLTQLIRSGTNLTGVLTTGTSANGGFEPAFKNVQIVFDGFDLVAVTFEAHPVGEVGYITITASLTPTQIAVAV